MIDIETIVNLIREAVSDYLSRIEFIETRMEELERLIYSHKEDIDQSLREAFDKIQDLDDRVMR